MGMNLPRRKKRFWDQRLCMRLLFVFFALVSFYSTLVIYRTLQSPHCQPRSNPARIDKENPLPFPVLQIERGSKEDLGLTPFEVCPRINSNLAVVIPFQPSEIEEIVSHVARWDQEWSIPCEEGEVYNIDLYFYHGRDLTDDSLQKRLFPILDRTGKRHCFRKVQFLSAGITSPPPPKRNLRDLGTQFYKLFQILTDYDYFFLMEGDTIPIRKGWLRKLWLEASCGDEFWIKGSNYRKADSRDVKLFGYHINGNALYSTCRREERCATFIKTCNEKMRRRAYDEYIWKQMHRRAAGDNRELLGKYVYTEMVQNIYHNVLWNATEIAKESPETYFVHGKTFVLPNGEKSKKYIEFLEEQRKKEEEEAKRTLEEVQDDTNKQEKF